MNYSLLHICNDFAGSKVHKNLYEELDNLGLNQIIFCPTRKTTDKERNLIKFKVHTSLIVYSKPLRIYHRLLFKNKVKFLYKNLMDQIALNKFDLVHATTLFSDGAIALKIFERFSIPFIVNVRTTDIGIFLKYRPDLVSVAKKILSNSTQIIFVTEALRNNFLNHHLIRTFKSSIFQKTKVIPNGIDSFWLSSVRKRQIDLPKNILFVGNFSANKNVIKLIEAFLRIYSHYPQMKLNLVGENGKQEKKIRMMSEQYKGIINCLGAIYDKEDLKTIFRRNQIFAMVSIRETFGLVYLEALTQGLPVLYTRNEGIEGVLQSKIGESVNPKSVKSIENGLLKLVINYGDYLNNQEELFDFNWPQIGKQYLEIYMKMEEI